MIDLSNSPAYVNIDIACNKMFEENIINSFGIKELKWLMSIKPSTRDVTPYIEDRIRMEEIEVFYIRISEFPDKISLKSMLSEMCSKVSYPCVVFVGYGDKYKILAWKFADSVRLIDKNVLHSFFESAWIHEPSYSEKADKCVETIKNLLLNGESGINVLYDDICKAISNFYPQYIGSFKHLKTIVYDLTGNNSFVNSIPSTKRYEVKNSFEKHRKKEYGTMFKYVYEYEDIWNSFMKDEKIKNIINNRRYRDIEDLVLSIDSKYEEYSGY